MKTKTFLWSLLFLLAGGFLFAACGSDSDDDGDDDVTPPAPVKELTFELHVGNIMAHGAELKVVPSDKEKQYIADVAPATMFENKSDEDIISMIIGAAVNEKLIKGDVLFKAEGMNLEPETEYVLFALGIENDKASSRLARRNFTTAEDPVPVPELNVSGVVGDSEGNNRHSHLMFNAKSDIAEKLIYLFADNAKEGEQIKDEAYLEKLINEQGQTATEDEIKTLNSAEGISFSFDNLEAEHEYTFIARVSNKSGAVTKQITLKTDAAPAPPKGPEITLAGQAGDKDGNRKDSYLMFRLSSTTKDVYYAELIVSAKSEVDKVLELGLTLEELAVSNKGNGLILSDEDVNTVNSSTYVAALDNTDGVKPDTEYTCIALVENFMGVMSIARVDVKTAETKEDNTPPSVNIEGFAGDVNGNNKNLMVTYKASCTSKNASYAEAFIAEATFVDEILQGTTLEELMTYNAGMGKIMDQSKIDILNQDVLTLTWDNLLGNTLYSLLFCVKTKGGGITVKRCDVMTEPDAATANVGYAQQKVEGILSMGNVRLGDSGRIIDNLKYSVSKKNTLPTRINNNVNVGKLPGLFL